MPYLSLSVGDLALAALLVLINGALSLALQLGLAKKLAIASARMVAQLCLMGQALHWLFASRSPWLTLLTALAMVAFAGHEAMARQERRLHGGWSYALGAGAMLAAAGLVTVFAMTLLLRPHPWHDPRYVIPLLGMILGNTMTGVALGLNTLTHEVHLTSSPA